MAFRKMTTGLSLVVLLAGGMSPQAVLAEPSVSAITNAITAANVLDPDATMRVSVDDDKVYVSTYRNPNEDENDCKINAVLIAKAVLSASGDSVSRVTVFFYGQDNTHYLEVSVTAGDVKAYGAGATNQEQLLKSIVVERKQQFTDSDRITLQLQNRAYSRPDYRVDMKSPTELVITSPLANWVPNEDAKVEAVRIASTVASVAPNTVQQIRVSFKDPRSAAQRREVMIKRDEAAALWQQVQSALSALQVTKAEASLDLAQIEPQPGVALVERKTLLKRIRDAAAKGIGVAPFVKAYLNVESMVPQGNEQAVVKEILRLHGSLDAQAAAYVAAKEAKFSTNNKPQGETQGRHSDVDLGSSKFWFHGQKPFPNSQIAESPDTVIQQAEGMCGGAQKAERDPDFLKLLLYMSTILRKDNNVAMAAKVEGRAARMRSAGIK